MSLILAVISGYVNSLSFPPFNSYILIWITLVPLFIVLLKEKSPKKAFIFGFLFGLGFFGAIYFPTTQLSAFGGWLAVVGWLALAAYQALFIGVYAFCMAKMQTKQLFPLLAGLLWAVIEWARALGPFGISSGALAYSQTNFLLLLQISNIFGMYAVGFLIILFNASIAYLIIKRRSLFLFLSLILVGLALLYGFSCLNTKNNTGKPLKVVVLQANIDQFTRLSPWASNYSVKVYEEMTKQALDHDPDLIVWPETAVVDYIINKKRVFSKYQDIFGQAKKPFLIGLPYYDYRAKRAYNSVGLFSSDSTLLGRYDKEHLVAFGEYLPFRYILERFFKNGSLFAADYWPNLDPKILKFGNYNLGIGICFESIFPSLISKRVKQGANLIFTLTNDAWFFNSAALEQHFNAGILRAIENRRYFVQAANTGISGFVDPCGRVYKRAEANKQVILSATIYTIDKNTFYTRFGDVFIWGSIVFLLLSAFGAQIFQRKL